jgi:RNA-directed DNA polymerase
MSEPKSQVKSHDIPKRLVWGAWLKVKENGGAAGADGVTIGQFEERLKDRGLSKTLFEEEKPDCGAE